jgi:hypothetical protein
VTSAAAIVVDALKLLLSAIWTLPPVVCLATGPPASE